MNELHYGAEFSSINAAIADGSLVSAQSFAVTPVELIGENGRLISHGTGFFYKSATESFLVTNWHNVSGKNPFTLNNMNKNGAVPKTIKFFPAKKHTYIKDAVVIVRAAVEMPLWRDWNEPLWLEHPDFEKCRVDLVALKVENKYISDFHITDGDDYDLLSLVGMDVFILGYPFKNYVQTMPGIWKRGSLASEPKMPVGGRPMFLIDAASRPGMSGAPVFRRQFGPAVDKLMSMKLDNVVSTKFVGVYSGHLQAGFDEVTLGFAWGSQLVDPLVNNPNPAQRY